MDIDKLYRSIGTMVKRAWYQYVSRPIKNYNVDNRAEKVIDKSSKKGFSKAAPWHETTKQIMQEFKKDGAFEKYDQFNSQLADRLKSVKVFSHDEEEPHKETPIDDGKSKFPKDRIGIAMPYVFVRPEIVPRGKITVMDALEMLINAQKEKTSPKEIAAGYDISEENVEKILRYVDVFKAVNKKKIEINIYGLYEEMDKLNYDLDEEGLWATGKDELKRQARIKAQKEAKEKANAENVKQ